MIDWKKALAHGSCGAQFFDAFARQAQSAAAEIVRVSTFADVHARVKDLAEKARVRRIVATDDARAPGLLQHLRPWFDVKTEDLRTHAETADLGICAVEFGIAETGSVCLDALTMPRRLVSTLPPIHVAILQSEHIVPDMNEACAVLGEVFASGNVTFITGPSRTADIERVLTIGVHGPSRLIVMAVDEDLDGGAS